MSEPSIVAGGEASPLWRTAALTLIALGAASTVYRRLAEARDARRYPPPGELVDIGGRCLHLCRAGEGAPSVVFVPCLGGPGSEWQAVQEGMAQYTGAYIYDRAGLGWSDPGSWPRAYPRMADELHDLIVAAKIPAPYVVVGHSTGGIIARQFAARHPEGLAGLALVESSHEDQIRRLSPSPYGRMYFLRQALRCKFTSSGLYRFAADLGFRDHPTDPVGIISQSSRCHRADAQELINQMLMPPGTQPPDLGGLPLLVITAGAAGRGIRQAAWQELQGELTALSTRSTHVVIEHVGHHINRDDPHALVEQLRQFIKSIAAERSNR